MNPITMNTTLILNINIIRMESRLLWNEMQFCISLFRNILKTNLYKILLNQAITVITIRRSMFIYAVCLTSCDSSSLTYLVSRTHLNTSTNLWVYPLRRGIQKFRMWQGNFSNFLYSDFPILRFFRYGKIIIRKFPVIKSTIFLKW